MNRKELKQCKCVVTFALIGGAVGVIACDTESEDVELHVHGNSFQAGVGASARCI
jgi:hypothetical protein